MKTVAVDFDGVVHNYRKGWYDGSVYDVPVEGAFEALGRLLDSYYVVIFSTREPKQIFDWFQSQEGWTRPVKVVPDNAEFEWKEKGVLGITNKKLKAFIYIDDRAVRFTNWKDMLNYVR